MYLFLYLHVLDNDSATSDPDAEVTARTNGKGSPDEQSPSPVQFINSVGAVDSSRSTLQRYSDRIRASPASYLPIRRETDFSGLITSGTDWQW